MRCGEIPLKNQFLNLKISSRVLFNLHILNWFKGGSEWGQLISKKICAVMWSESVWFVKCIYRCNSCGFPLPGERWWVGDQWGLGSSSRWLPRELRPRQFQASGLSVIRCDHYDQVLACVFVVLGKKNTRVTEIEIKKNTYTKEDCNSGHTCQLNSPDTDHVNDEPVGLEAAKHQGVEVRKIGRLELAAAKDHKGKNEIVT